MTPYLHTIQYYETDMMGIVHHSNFIRWFEEARTDMAAQIGLPYSLHESEGILSPVLSVSVRYHRPMAYGQVAKVKVHVTKITGAKLFVSYQVFDAQTDVLCASGDSAHGYVNKEFKPISLKRVKPEWYERYKSLEEQIIEE